MCPKKKAVCPLFNFEISSVITKVHDREVIYEKMGEQVFEKGFDILDNVRIRRISREDLRRLKAFPAVDFWSLLPGVFSRINEKTLVIEFLGKDVNELNNVESIVYNILLGIRLHRPVSVFSKIIWFEEDSRVKSLAVLDTRLPDIGGRILLDEVLGIDEIEEVKAMVNKIDRIDFNKRKSLRIACERFNRAYEEHREDEIIIDIMIAFEALFHERKLPQQRRRGALPGKGQFIGLGCSMLLGKDQREREEIHEFLVKAYRVRNNIVHGEEYKTPIEVNNKPYEMRDFINQLHGHLSQSLKRLID